MIIVARRVAQSAQDASGRGKQPVLSCGRGQLAEPRTEHEASLQVASDQSVVLERDREPVGRGPGQPGRGHQTGEVLRSGLEGA